jgi:hypothetical protein
MYSAENYLLSLARSLTQFTGDSMKRYLILVCLVLSACNLSTAPPAPAVPAGPTAYIDPSYPTMESAPVNSSQTTSGIEVRADRAWRCLLHSAGCLRLVYLERELAVSWRIGIGFQFYPFQYSRARGRTIWSALRHPCVSQRPARCRSYQRDRDCGCDRGATARRRLLHDLYA